MLLFKRNRENELLKQCSSRIFVECFETEAFVVSTEWILTSTSGFSSNTDLYSFRGTLGCHIATGPVNHWWSYRNSLVVKPREAMSPGLIVWSMWYRWSGYNLSRMWWTLLPTYVWKQGESLFMYPKTTEESCMVHFLQVFIGKFFLNIKVWLTAAVSSHRVLTLVWLELLYSNP